MNQSLVGKSKRSGLSTKRVIALICGVTLVSVLFAPAAKAQSEQAESLNDVAARFDRDSAISPESQAAGSTSNLSNEGTPQPRHQATMLKGQATYCVPSGTPIKLKLASVPTSGMELLDRDLDGNLLPAKLGQEITAKTSEDLYVDDHRVIPEGSIFHGRVTKLLPPRRLSRNGSLVISFDELKTPDGRTFAFHAEADNSKQSTAKTKAKGFGIIAANAAGGAIVGAIAAYQLFGLHETIAMHGYNIAGGAAGGALLATTYAIMKHGKKAALEPGDDLNMAFNSDLLMPAAVEATPKPKAANMEGLDIKIKKSKLIKDGLDGHVLQMDVSITNDSDKGLKSVDLFLEDTNGNRLPLVGGSDDESDFLFEVDPHTEKTTRLYFQIEWPKLKRTLIWLNHHNRQVCYRIPCP